MADVIFIEVNNKFNTDLIVEAGWTRYSIILNDEHNYIESMRVMNKYSCIEYSYSEQILVIERVRIKYFESVLIEDLKKANNEGLDIHLEERFGHYINELLDANAINHILNN